MGNFILNRVVCFELKRLYVFEVNIRLGGIGLFCAGTGLNLLVVAFRLLQRVEVILEHEFVQSGDRGMEWCLVGIDMNEF